MAISKFEIKRCENEIAKFLEQRRPPVAVREQLDFGYHIDNQSVELYEIRPNWSNPEEKMQIPFAKTTYVKKDKQWKVYWQRQDLKWHPYEPAASVKYFEEFLELVNKDAHACFFG